MVDVLASERTTPQDDVILALRCLIVTKQATLPAEARNAEIPAELDRAIDEMSRLATRMSRVPMYRALLAEAFLARARRQSDPAGALADAQRGLDLARALEQQQPTPENRWRAQEAAKIVEGLDARRREWEPCGGKIPPKLAPTTRISDFLRRVSPTGPILCT
jgi:hypothetical protein